MRNKLKGKREIGRGEQKGGSSHSRKMRTDTNGGKCGRDIDKSGGGTGRGERRRVEETKG